MRIVQPLCIFTVAKLTQMEEVYRKIIHVDMDAFFAAVEERDHPEYRGIPLAVGSPQPRSVIATANYEARKYGVHSALSSRQAQKLCPKLIFAYPRFDVYKSVSKEIRAIFHEYTDLVEPLSLDEAFLDVTENKAGQPLAKIIALDIKQKIKERLNLTASAGVSYNKFLAKVASDMKKPDGLTVIHPSRALEIIAGLPVEAFWGVGKVTAEHMHELGLHTGKDLQSTDENYLIQHFGKAGKMFAEFAMGIDERPVETTHERLSVGCERTFDLDIFNKEEIEQELIPIANDLERRIEKASFQAYTLVLKIKRDDFKQFTRSITVEVPVRYTDDIIPLAYKLLENFDTEGHGVRLLGLSVTKPQPKEMSVLMDTQLEIPYGFEKDCY